MIIVKLYIALARVAVIINFHPKSDILKFHIELLIIQQMVKEWHTQRTKSLFVLAFTFLHKAFCEYIYQH